MTLEHALSTASGKGRYVRGLFARIADRYDLITVLLSYGLDRHWKRRLIERMDVRGRMRVLDVATGTGDLATLASQRGCAVIGLDITWRMLQLAAAKRPVPCRSFVRGDMAALPFPDASFDVVTAGYGIRNAADLGRALDEIARVVRPGGQLLSLDFDRPANPLLRRLYLGYLTCVGSVMGFILHRDPDTYRYIPMSLRAYPGSLRVVDMLHDRGFDRVKVIPVLGGLMAMHHALKATGSTDGH